MANKCPTFSNIIKHNMPRYIPTPLVKRLSAAKRGYDTRWKYIRLWFLKAHPLCTDCLLDNKLTPSEEVHHIKALADGGTHEETNLMALCKSCHSRRTKRGL